MRSGPFAVRNGAGAQHSNPCSLGNSAAQRDPLFSNHRRNGSDTRFQSTQMEKVMNTQSNNTQVHAELSDNDLNAVVGGHEKFHYVEMNGNTYAIGHIHGQTVMVKVT